MRVLGWLLILVAVPFIVFGLPFVWTGALLLDEADDADARKSKQSADIVQFPSKA